MKPFWEIRRRGTVTTPAGFQASGLHCGIKKNKKRYDSSLVYSEAPCVAAATFTKNKVKAWPVIYSQKAIKAAKHHAILASSGNANCVNGPQGKRSVQEAVADLAAHLNVNPEEILMAQTGLIGVRFPITRYRRGLPKLVKRLSSSGGRAAAKGILTTDTKVKEVALSFMLGDKKVSIGAISKGVGMVHPNMATMLCFISTDIAITKPLLKRALRHVVDDTFNKMAIDNDMSTNDLVFVLANGQAGTHTLSKVDKEYRMFRHVLEEVCRIMAYKMVRDGEGVGHVCTIRLSGAKNPTEAEKAARHIGNSMLFKTMLAGSDPNWGRIAAAIGASGVAYNVRNLHIAVDDVTIVHNGKVRVLSLPKARKVLQKKEYSIHVSIGRGRGKCDFVTSDLTSRYVQINAAYS